MVLTKWKRLKQYQISTLIQLIAFSQPQPLYLLHLGHLHLLQLGHLLQLQHLSQNNLKDALLTNQIISWSTVNACFTNKKDLTILLHKKTAVELCPMANFLSPQMKLKMIWFTKHYNSCSVQVTFVLVLMTSQAKAISPTTQVLKLYPWDLGSMVNLTGDLLKTVLFMEITVLGDGWIISVQED